MDGRSQRKIRIIDIVLLVATVVSMFLLASMYLWQEGQSSTTEVVCLPSSYLRNLYGKWLLLTGCMALGGLSVLTIGNLHSMTSTQGGSSRLLKIGMIFYMLMTILFLIVLFHSPSFLSIQNPEGNVSIQHTASIAFALLCLGFSFMVIYLLYERSNMYLAVVLVYLMTMVHHALSMGVIFQNRELLCMTSPVTNAQTSDSQATESRSNADTNQDVAEASTSDTTDTSHKDVRVQATDKLADVAFSKTELITLGVNVAMFLISLMGIANIGMSFRSTGY